MKTITEIITNIVKRDGLNLRESVSHASSCCLFKFSKENLTLFGSRGFNVNDISDVMARIPVDEVIVILNFVILSFTTLRARG